MISQAYANSFSMSDKVLAIGVVATGTTMSHMQTLFFPSNHYVLNIFFFLRVIYVQMNLLQLRDHYQEQWAISGEWCGRREQKHL